MPIVIASNFGDLGAAELMIQGLVVASIVSFLSLVFALPRPLREHGRWHGWIALAVSGVFLVCSLYLLTTMQRSLHLDDLVLLGILCAPALVALLSLFLSRKKNA
jgi:hypothetical protein